jgi:hypothetical protein
MQISIDTDQFDALQMRLLEEIILSVASGLKEAGITEDSALSEAVEKITFSVAAIIDGSRVMELEGRAVVPVLTFAKERNGIELIGAEGGSWMHEYVCGTVDDVLFGEDDDQ